MQKYSDVVLDGNGKGVTGATITVVTYPDGQPATIYAADGGPAVPFIKTDQTGRFAFYAENGHYSVTVSGTGIVPTSDNDLTLFDPRASHIVCAKDFGAAADGIANDTPTIAPADLAAGKLAEYNVTAFAPIYGNDITPNGVAHNRTTGRVYNPRAHRSMQIFGWEVLQHWFSLFLNNSDTVSPGNGTVKRIVLSGDSVTFGYNNNNWGVPTNILTILAAQRGYKNVEVVNRGQSGKACFQWLTDYLSGDLALNPDLLILGWGDNDFGLGRTVEQLLADYRTGLAQIRKSRPVTQLSIILRTPTSMNDIENGRTQVKLEQIVEGFKQLARDFQCGFVDTYSMFHNSHDGAGIWFDWDHGRSIHPGDQLQVNICGAIAQLCLPDHGTDWQNNRVYNYSGAMPGNKRGLGDPPNSFFDGISMNRFGEGAGNALGAPYDGWSLTYKQADSAALQFLSPLAGATPGRGLSARLGFNNAWGPVIGGKFSGAALLQNGWVDAPGGGAGFVYWIGFDGAVYLAGTIGAGTKVDGTVLFTLPDGFRPTAGQVATCTTETGQARLSVESGGNVKLYGGASAGNYITLNGVYFY